MCVATFNFARIVVGIWLLAVLAAGICEICSLSISANRLVFATCLLNCPKFFGFCVVLLATFLPHYLHIFLLFIGLISCVLGFMHACNLQLAFCFLTLLLSCVLVACIICSLSLIVPPNCLMSFLLHL